MKQSQGSDYDKLFQSVRSIAESVQSLNRQAVAEYAPLVESIIRSRSRDTAYIEQTPNASEGDES